MGKRMDDVGHRLWSLGLNGDEVTLEKLTEVEWKIGDIKVHVCFLGGLQSVENLF